MICTHYKAVKVLNFSLSDFGIKKSEFRILHSDEALLKFNSGPEPETLNFKREANYIVFAGFLQKLTPETVKAQNTAHSWRRVKLCRRMTKRGLKTWLLRCVLQAKKPNVKVLIYVKKRR